METTGTIKKQSSAHGVELNVDKGMLDHQFNAYWDQVKDVLNPNIIKMAQKGGYRKITRDRVVKVVGGPGEFFKPVLADHLREYLDTQPYQALSVNEVSLLETPSQYVIQALVYMEPLITWKDGVPGVDKPLIVKIPKEPENLVSRMVNEEIELAREKSAILKPADPEAIAAEGHVIAMDCESLLDGVRWEPGCFIAKKWYLHRPLFSIPEMIDEVLGMKSRETKKFTAVLNDKFTEDVRGKTVDITLHVNQIFTRHRPEIDDDLGKTFGFDTLEAFKSSLTAKCSDKLEADRKKLIMMSCMQQVMTPETMDVEPVPFGWMAQKAKEIYAQGRATVKTEEEMVVAFKGQSLMNGDPVVDKNTILVFLAEQSAMSLIQDLVVREWGRKKGVEGNLLLENMTEYVAKVKDALIDTVVLETYDVIPETEKTNEEEANNQDKEARQE